MADIIGTDSYSKIKRLSPEELEKLWYSFLDDKTNKNLRNSLIVQYLFFETYAIMRIRGCIIDKIRAQDWLPRSARKKIKDVKEAAEKLKQELGRAATSTEIGEALGIEKEKVDAILAEATSVGSLYDKKGTSDDSIEIIETIEDTNSVNPLDKLEEKDTTKELQMALKSLPERERMIMVLYYQKNMTLKEIGETIEVSESRVCQLHAQAIMKLKNILSGQRNERMKKSII